MHFEISERKILLRIFDVIFVFIALLVVEKTLQFDYLNFSRKDHYWSIVLGIYLVFFGSVFEMYNLQVASKQDQVLKSITLTSSTTVLLFLLTPVYTPSLPSNRLQILIFYIAVFGSLLLWRTVYVRFFASNRFLKKVVLVCDSDQAEELISGLENVDPHYRVLGYVNTDSNNEITNFKKTKMIATDTLKSFVIDNAISEIVVASQKTDGITVELYNQLLFILEKGFIIREYTQVYESITQRVPVQYVSRDFYRYFPFSRSNQNHLYLLVIRLAEVIIACTGLVIGFLLSVPILCANLFFNKGSLFYKQSRVGKNGEVFTIYKFRTMVKNAERHGAVFATVNDTRVTPFGKILRKTRIDEFPQFINILKGEMAVIGPRPERPVFVKEIAERMPFYETRHIIKPGLTGWAQVNYTYGATIEDSLIKLQYDLYYIKHRSLLLDVSIIFKTLSTILFYRGH